MTYWIQGAVEKPGSYTASVRRRYGKAGFKDGIKTSILRKDAKHPGRIGKQARLAMTLRRMRK